MLTCVAGHFCSYSVRLLVRIVDMKWRDGCTGCDLGGREDAIRRTCPCRRCCSSRRLGSWTCRRWPASSPGTGRPERLRLGRVRGRQTGWRPGRRRLGRRRPERRRPPKRALNTASSDSWPAPDMRRSAFRSWRPPALATGPAAPPRPPAPEPLAGPPAAAAPTSYRRRRYRAAAAAAVAAAAGGGGGGGRAGVRPGRPVRPRRAGSGT